MLLLVSFLLLIILFSRITEEVTKIPSTLCVIVYAFAISLFFPQLFSVNAQEFDEILYLMLPVILLPDILNISVKELKVHVKEIFYLAVISVVLSIVIATLITPYIMPQYSFSVGMLIALFSMLMATDAITVTSIMNKFQLPVRLKIYAESESIFNDVTSLVIFYFIALPLISGTEVTILSVNYMLLKVLIFSIVIGIFVAYIGYLVIKILKNPFDQLVVIYLVVIVSFLAAEHFHIAGILSIIAATLTFKYFIQKETINGVESTHKNDDAQMMKDKYSIIELVKSVPAVTHREFREYKKEAMFIGIFANAIVFVIIANIVKLSLLLDYAYEIMIIFVITTVIRFASVSSLAVWMKLPFRWANVLTLSGVKGALAIIMVHSLPQSFIYKEMFEALVVGNVLVSTFLYTFLLMFHIKFNQKAYEQDIEIDSQSQDEGMVKYTKKLVEILEKDSLTQAYNRQFIGDKINKELARSSRYKLELSFLMLKLSDNVKTKKSELEVMGSVVEKSVRMNDHFGKLSNDEYIIMTTNTSLSGAVILAEKISSMLVLEVKIQDYYFGVTQASETDCMDDILEKLHEAINRSLQNESHQIEIEA